MKISALMLGKIEDRRRRRQQGRVVWHHQFNEHEFGHTPGDSEGQGSLVDSSPWDCRVGHALVTDQQLHNACIQIHADSFLRNSMPLRIDIQQIIMCW